MYIPFILTSHYCLSLGKIWMNLFDSQFSPSFLSDVFVCEFFDVWPPVKWCHWPRAPIFLRNESIIMYICFTLMSWSLAPSCLETKKHNDANHHVTLECERDFYRDVFASLRDDFSFSLLKCISWRLWISGKGKGHRWKTSERPLKYRLAIYLRWKGCKNLPGLAGTPWQMGGVRS